jgi:hypothetical protein
VTSWGNVKGLHSCTLMGITSKTWAMMNAIPNSMEMLTMNKSSSLLFIVEIHGNSQRMQQGTR